MSDVNLEKSDDSQEVVPTGAEDPAAGLSFADVAEMGHTATELDPNAKPVLSVEQIQQAERLTNSTPENLASGVLR